MMGASNRMNPVWFALTAAAFDGLSDPVISFRRTFVTLPGGCLSRSRRLWECVISGRICGLRCLGRRLSYSDLKFPQAVASLGTYRELNFRIPRVVMPSPVSSQQGGGQRQECTMQQFYFGLDVSLDDTRRELSYSAIVVEGTHMRAAIREQASKTDRNDARGIAHMMRHAWYKPVHVKSAEGQRLRALLSNRRILKC